VDVLFWSRIYLPWRLAGGRVVLSTIATSRIVLSELLDELEPNDPRARRSRRDLQRIHRVMGSLSILKRAIVGLQLAARPRHILELGAGDGSLLLRFARTLKPKWGGIALTVLDRYDLLSAATRNAYESLGWSLTVLRADALSWAAQDHPQHFDLCITTLFLHHFDAPALGILMPTIAANVDAFVACEPRRNTIAWLGSHAIGLLGANAVTRGDAVKSVAAGFAHQELTAFWPRAGGRWVLKESAAPPFTHCFTAVRTGSRSERHL
jgi:SAM-dependent methyltransferase